ncbi:quinone oxidoreductase family protein [Terribacillus saccharophilus]|uniref:quinone oxidoreductase family protein n=1 Tax=Terribacillus saccharophilus TaxID=361277 RepID=UPI000BA5D9CC|nr:zinc-binding dehydrogenase [Terribacillus saccharophilus]PAF19246.1 quinone oxidoreductase [Terribacillus saccharophilus]
MRAIVAASLGGPDVLEYKDITVPEPSTGEVRIKVLKASVHFADIKKRKGTKGSGIPGILGLDAVGIIDKVGQDVTGLRIGDRVITFVKTGAYAEFAIANASLVYPIADHVDTAVAAACPVPSFLSFMLLERVGRLEKGETVLVHAASGRTGLTLIQLARKLGAGKVIGTVSDDQKAALPMKLGADHCVTYDNFSQSIQNLTDGAGADLILDSLAGSVMEESFTCLAPYGRLVNYGNASGAAGFIKTSDVHSSCRSLLGYSLGTTRKKRPEDLKRIADQVISLVEMGDITFPSIQEFKLEDANKAHQLMESRTHAGKIILHITD